MARTAAAVCRRWTTISLWLEVKTAQSAGSIRIQSPEAAPGFEVVQGAAPQVQTIVLTEEALTSARKGWRRFR